MVGHVEEMSLESPRKMQDEQEVMSETSANATSGRGHDAWRLEPEGETETLETKVFFLERGGRLSPDTLMVKVTMSGELVEKFQKGKRSARGRR